MPILEEGQEIRETYVVERYIGEGAFAEVYRVRHKFLGRQALKLFKQPGMTQTDIMNMLKEATLLSKLGHPNIVRVFDANTLWIDGQERGYFTMELVPTGTLEDLRMRNPYGPVSAQRAVNATMQVLQGLEVAHSQTPPIIHRDLKPQNILFAESDAGTVAKVSDFGLATQVDPLTLMSCPAGTLAFKSPEALFAGGVDSVASDIWSVGVMLYQLLTDRMPYPPTNEWGWSQIAYKNPHRPARTFNFEVDEALDAILSKCLKIEPHLRYDKVGSLLGDLRRWKPTRRPITSQIAMTLPDEKVARGNEKSPSPEQQRALELINAAEQLAREHRLAEASRLGDEALSIWPSLAASWSHRIHLWRKGLSN